MSIGYSSPLAGMPVVDYTTRHVSAAEQARLDAVQDSIDSAYALFALEAAANGHAGYDPELFISPVARYRVPIYGSGEATYPGGWLPGQLANKRASHSAQVWVQLFEAEAQAAAIKAAEAAKVAKAAAKAAAEAQAFRDSGNPFAVLAALRKTEQA